MNIALEHEFSYISLASIINISRSDNAKEKQLTKKIHHHLMQSVFIFCSMLLASVRHAFY